MDVLHAGMETEEGIDALLSFTMLSSEGMRRALIRHLVNGWPDSQACLAGPVLTGNFSRDLAKLNAVASKIVAYNEHEYARLGAQLKAMKAELIELKGVGNE